MSKYYRVGGLSEAELKSIAHEAKEAKEHVEVIGREEPKKLATEGHEFTVRASNEAVLRLLAKTGTIIVGCSEPITPAA